jgi:putative Mn2+ efflux pump MntP
MIISFGVYMFSFAISVGGVIYVYTTEIIPAKVLMVPFVMQAVLTVVIGAFTLKLINTFGLFSLYAAFGFFALIGWFIFEGIAIETKNKENSEIIEEFKTKKFMR